MITRLRKWWRDSTKPTDDTEVLDELAEMERGAEEVLAQSNETRQVLKESGMKARQADTRIKGYQERINKEYARRLSVMRGDRGSPR